MTRVPSALWSDTPGLVASWSHAADGDMRLSGDGGNEQNRRKYLQSIGIDSARVVSAGLIHGTNVMRVSAADGGSVLAETDALITADDGIFLTITIADCLPVFFRDTQTNAFALAHAGWRGMIGGVLQHTAAALMREYGSAPEHIEAAIGPGVCALHYEVGEDVASAFSAMPGTVTDYSGKPHIDLARAARAALVFSGILERNIRSCGICTYESVDLFSLRREKTVPPRVFMAVIGRP